MLFEQFSWLRLTSSRGWQWHSVPVSKGTRAFSSIPSRYFLGISAETSSLKHQQTSDKMVSFRDYEIFLLFLLLVKLRGSGKSDIYSSVQKILQCFLPCVILSLETENADALFLIVMSVKMTPALQGGF